MSAVVIAICSMVMAVYMGWLCLMSSTALSLCAKVRTLFDYFIMARMSSTICSSSRRLSASSWRRL